MNGLNAMGRFDIHNKVITNQSAMKPKAAILLMLIFLITVAFSATPKIDDPYLQWATRQFGKPAAKEVKKVFVQSFGTPVHTAWKKEVWHPDSQSLFKNQTGINPEKQPWAEAEKKYAFIADFENLEPRIAGIREKANFNYWRHVFYYFRSRAKTACLIGEMDEFAKQSAQQTNQIGNKIRLASLTLDRRNQAAEEWHKMINYRRACLKINPQKESVAIKKDDRATLKLLILHDGLIKDVLGQTAPVLNFPEE